MRDEEPDFRTCPKCGGPADNGHDRCLPPSPYLCTKCIEARNWYSVPEIHLSPEDQSAFAEAILNPPEPNEALRRILKPE